MKWGGYVWQTCQLKYLNFSKPITSTWPHLKCDVGLERKENINRTAVYHYDGAQWYEQLLQISRLNWALILLGLAVYHLSASISLVFVVLYVCKKNLYYILFFTLYWAEPGGIGPWCGWLTIVLQCCGLWRCWLGHLTHKVISEMTYNLLSGTLNHTVWVTCIVPPWVCVWRLESENIDMPFGMEKLEWLGYPTVKKFWRDVRCISVMFVYVYVVYEYTYLSTQLIERSPDLT